MPLLSESVANKPLSGQELIEVICNDVRETLQKDGMFSAYVAYRQISYSIDVHIHTGNPMKPEHTALVRAKRSPAMGVEGPPPLVQPVGEQGRVDLTIERMVDSPNLTRIANDLPITVYAQEKGRTVERTVSYDKSNYPQPSPAIVTDNLPIETGGRK